MTLTLRYMRPSDVPAVVEIDALSFPDPWPLRSYMFEVNESRISHMCALTLDEAPPSPTEQSLIDRLLRRKPVPARAETIAAYGGLWCIGEEAHISTIAAHPQLRGRGYGEIVLAGMLLRALALHAEYAVLEVRVSNRIAQNLYQKYGFVIVDVTRKYYRDGEDAFLMRLELTQPDAAETLQARYDQLQQRCPFNDEYSRISHPRLGA
jgi:ribosomal-protein-alanine N-acetyltransferase